MLPNDATSLVVSVVSSGGAKVMNRCFVKYSVTESEIIRLSVEHRVQYKLAALTYKICATSTLDYLNNEQSYFTLCLLDQNDDVISIMHILNKNSFCKYAFSVWAPVVCNSLPDRISKKSTIWDLF